ncbi:hypothetical protein SEMRO_3583_G349350.1 [Seminavis robusta]|uniref:Uncharacterized protein n=1 Tax=Seminavis robusta TaxID=568900 RepID=A0A9N8HY31_9STRA|nr:hypothetical protein SEMRO_3583_G349350.1 [Seminavis robusta]|eukprot:Sro3583_g349350.1 n/a (309) ;mRNA; f:4346-5272
MANQYSRVKYILRGRTVMAMSPAKFPPMSSPAKAPPTPPSPNEDRIFGFFTQATPQRLPPASPMVARTGKGKPKDDRLFGTPEKENQPNQPPAGKRPPRTPEDAPPMKRNDVVPSIEKQINRQLAGLDQDGSYTGGHMEMGESPFMFLLADVFVTSRTKTHRLGWWQRKASPNSVTTVSSTEEEPISEGTLKKWLIEESQHNARILAKNGPSTPHRMGEPKPPKEKKNEPQKQKLPKGGKTRIDKIMRIIRKDITNEFVHNPRMMELSAGEIANRMESVAMLLSLEASNLPSAVNHARAQKKNSSKSV